MLDIATETARHEWLKRRLLGEHPDLDEETLADTLEGLTDLNEVILSALRSALDDEGNIDAIKARIGERRARMDRIENRARSKRRICAEAMEACSLALDQRRGSERLLRARSKRVGIVDETLFAKKLLADPDPVIDRKSLGDALKAGLFPVSVHETD